MVAKLVVHAMFISLLITSCLESDNKEQTTDSDSTAVIDSLL